MGHDESLDCVRGSSTAPGWRILVADDDEDTVTSTAMLFQICGYEVLTARNGTAALDAAESWKPNVVTLDVALPPIDGYEVARRLRRLPGLDDVKLIALTGWGRPDDVRNALEAGFDHHVLKPFDCDMLIRLVAPPAGFKARS